MNKALLVLLLLVLGVGLYAQTGMFGLSYGDSYKKVKEKLAKMDDHFTDTTTTGSERCFVGFEDAQVDHIDAKFDAKLEKLLAWKIFFDGYYDEDQYDYVMETVSELHGVGDCDEDDEYSPYYWELGGGKMLYVGYNLDEWLVVEYYNPACSDFSEFSW